MLVVDAPVCGYGEAGNGQELAGETLVFVVDIVETRGRSSPTVLPEATRAPRGRVAFACSLG